jgi:hypothetical protein
MPTLTIPAALVLGGTLLYVGFRMYSFDRFKRLQWPARLGYYGFKRRVVRYLRRGGWIVDTKPWVPIDFFAYKGTRQIAVVCLPSDIDVNVSRVRDLASLPTALIRKRQVVCITVNQAAQHLVEDAANSHVLVLHYKHLASL